MLKGRTMLITGGGSGIGEALTTALAKDNHIIICGRNAAKLEKVAGATNNVSYYVADISVPGEIDHLFQRIQADGRILDVLINNAGVVEQWDMANTVLTSRQIFEKINTNLTGAIAVTQQFIRQSNPSADNLVVNITSSVVIFPFPILGLYATSKTGLSVFTNLLRHQLKGTHFRVVEILPSQVETEMPKQLGFTTKGANVQEVVRNIIRAINKGKTAYAPDPNVLVLKLLHRMLPKSGLLKMADKISKKLLKG